MSVRPQLGPNWRKACRVCSLLLVLTLVMGMPAMAGKQITVFLWKAWAGAQYAFVGKWLESVKNELEQKRPDVEVNYQYVDWGPDPIIIAVAGGVAPDVAIASIAYAFDLYDRGVILSLSDYWNRSSLTRFDFFPSARIFNQIRGEIFGAPWSMEAQTIIYNAEMMEQAGLNSAPNAIDSWGTLVKVAKKLWRQEGDRVTVAGFNTGLDLPIFSAWVYANGGQFYNRDFNGVACDDRQGREAMSFVAELLHVHRVGGPTGMQAFHAGQVGMMTNQLPAGKLLSDAPFRVGQTDFPPGPSGTRRSTVGWSNMYVIPSTSKNPDAGWAWIETMLSLPMQAKLAELVEPMAPYRQAFASSAAREAVRKSPYIANTPDILTNAGPYPYIRYGEVSQVANPLLNGVVRGELAPDAVLGEISRLVNPILAKVGVPK